MFDRAQLGKRIKEARQRAGLSQQQLANVIGVSDKTISAYEVGRVDPPLESLSQISTATSHHMAFFIGDVQSNIEAKLDRIAREMEEVRKLLQDSQKEEASPSQGVQSSQIVQPTQIVQPKEPVQIAEPPQVPQLTQTSPPIRIEPVAGQIQK